jgi:hypothetical protein
MADVDLEHEMLQVEQSKTQAGRRSIALMGLAVEALKQHRVRQLKERLKAHYWQDIALVFATIIGTPVRVNNFLTRDYYPLLLRGLNSYFQGLDDGDSWDEERILARGNELASRALVLWPRPNKLVHLATLPLASRPGAVLPQRAAGLSRFDTSRELDLGRQCYSPSLLHLG